MINLLSVGLASFNIHQSVPSHIPTHNQVILPENLKSQEYLEKINSWTKSKKMKLNERKTKNMVFNFTKKYQFSTNLKLNGEIIEVPQETKLLGTIITNDLKWDRNTH